MYRFFRPPASTEIYNLEDKKLAGYKKQLISSVMVNIEFIKSLGYKLFTNNRLYDIIQSLPIYDNTSYIDIYLSVKNNMTLYEYIGMATDESYPRLYTDLTTIAPTYLVDISVDIFTGMDQAKQMTPIRILDHGLPVYNIDIRDIMNIVKDELVTYDSWLTMGIDLPLLAVLKNYVKRTNDTIRVEENKIDLYRYIMDRMIESIVWDMMRLGYRNRYWGITNYSKDISKYRNYAISDKPLLGITNIERLFIAEYTEYYSKQKIDLYTILHNHKLLNKTILEILPDNIGDIFGGYYYEQLISYIRWIAYTLYLTPYEDLGSYRYKSILRTVNRTRILKHLPKEFNQEIYKYLDKLES